jgi:thioredoxin-related protein
MTWTTADGGLPPSANEVKGTSAMRLKTLAALAVCIASAAAIAATSTPKGFTDDLDAALAEARKTGKYVYACLSGSDWCGWCKKLDQEVFSDKEFDFVGALSKDYVFVYIDSPRNTDLLSEAARKRNPEQTKKFKIRGFPTALVLDGNGNTVEKTGYRRGGARKYADFLHEVRKDGPQRAAKNKRAQDVDDKYFKPFRARFREALKGLRADSSPADLRAAADKLDAIAKEIDGLKMDSADAEVAKDMQKQLSGQGRGIAEMIRRQLDKPAMKGKNDKKKAK